MNAAAATPVPAARALAALADSQPALPGGSAWARFRAEALTNLTAAGLPTPRDDGFKYANLRILERRDLRPYATAADAAASAVAQRLVVPDAHCIVIVDGIVQGPCDAAPGGVTIERLATTLARLAPCDTRWLTQPGPSADDRLRLWAAACLNDGLVIRVAPGIQLTTPIHLIHIATRGGSYPRVALELGAGSQLTLVEEQRSIGDADTVTVSVADLHIARDARLTHVRLQDCAERSILLEEVRVDVDTGGAYAHHAHSFGGLINRLDLAVTLSGAHAQTDLHGLFMADAGRGLHLRTRVTHAAPDTRSAQTYRGVAGSRGRGSYDGKVVVLHGASRSNSRQSSRNLLLAKDAEIDTRPQLEIYTDDVQASHGATTGTLDENMLFYLLSRGLDPATARGLLTYAFAADVVREIPVPSLRAALGRRVVGLLPDASRLEEFLT